MPLEGDRAPVLSRDGREIFYRSEDKMMVVEVKTFSPEYDVSPDGQRFLMVRRQEESTPRQIHVVLNWFEELKRLAPRN